MEQMIEHIIENSFKNFHVKGFDYLCLRRSAEVTEKIYFFDGNVSHLPEVVNPHDHRYDFATDVLSGVLEDRRYDVNPYRGAVYNKFHWRTPLNGGDGFTWVGEERLSLRESRLLGRGMTPLITSYRHIHTIEIKEPGTVIRLRQFGDRVHVNVPTKTFMQERQPPLLDGLYEKFTADEVLKKIDIIRELGVRI